MDNVSPQNNRSGCINAYLVFLLALMLLVALSSYNFLDDESVSTLSVVMVLIGNVIALVGIVGLWLWKRWGLMIMVAVLPFQIIVSLIIGINIIFIGVTAIGIGLLYYLYHDKWTWLE